MNSPDQNARPPGGLFITFEGPEGAGKSTQVRLLAEALGARGLRTCVTREPGGTPLGESLRKLIQHSHAPGGVCPEAELLLFGASRAQLVRSVIRPAVRRGEIVICDRFADSTTVYQGVARGLPEEFVRQMHTLTVGDCWPALTFLLDVPVQCGFSRKAVESENGELDRIELESREFHERVRRGFLALARRETNRIKVIDGTRPAAAVHLEILEIVHRAIG